MKFIIRILINAIIISIAAFFSPMRVTNYGAAVIAALIITILSYLAEEIFKIKASPIGKDVMSFIMSAIIIYLTGKIVSGFSAGIIGSLLGALVIGIVNGLFGDNNKVFK